MSVTEYADIVFLNGDDYDQMVAELFPDLPEAWSPRGRIEEDPERVMEYLAQWDYAEIGEVRAENPAGGADDVYDFPEQGYSMSVNASVGYAGLVRVLTEEEE